MSLSTLCFLIRRDETHPDQINLVETEVWYDLHHLFLGEELHLRGVHILYRGIICLQKLRVSAGTPTVELINVPALCKLPETTKKTQEVAAPS